MESIDEVQFMDLHTMILLLCVSSAVAGFSIGRASRLVTARTKPRSEEREPAAEDRVSFFKFTQLVLDLLPILLRQYFRERWQARYGRAWRDTHEDGEMFYRGTFSQRVVTVLDVEEGSTVARGDLAAVMHFPDGSPGLSPGDLVLLGEELHKVQSVKTSALHLSKPCSSTGAKELRIQLIRGEKNMDSRMQRFFEPKVLMGDTRDWDMSLLCFALLYSSHGLIPIGDDARQLVEGLRDLRNNKLAHISSCSMTREELWHAVHSMDAFIEYCLPSEWELWVSTSRDLLDQHPLAFEDGRGHSANAFSTQHTQGSDHIAIAIESDSDAEVDAEYLHDSQDIHSLLDRISTNHHRQFMEEAKARWLNELSVAATLTSSPFSFAAVKFT